MNQLKHLFPLLNLDVTVVRCSWLGLNGSGRYLYFLYFGHQMLTNKLSHAKEHPVLGLKKYPDILYCYNVLRVGS